MKIRNTKIAVLSLFTGFLIVTLGSSMWMSAVLAKPAFMDRYDRDPYSRAEYRNNCTLCHIGRGGGERNDLGEAFEDSGYRFTPKVRAAFPKFFAPAILPK